MKIHKFRAKNDIKNYSYTRETKQIYVDGSNTY